jgi:hypothetical protein
VDIPTAVEVRAYPIRADWAALGYPTGTPDTLDKLLEWSAAWVQQVTGQLLGPTAPDPLSWDGAHNLRPLMEQAIALRALQVASQSQPDYLETLADFDLIQSFSAGSYSETRRDPTRRGEGKTINDWPPLNELLWTLMTPDQYAYWQAFLTGKPTPDWGVSEVDWSGRGALTLPGGTLNPTYQLGYGTGDEFDEDLGVYGGDSY